MGKLQNARSIISSWKLLQHVVRGNGLHSTSSHVAKAVNLPTIDYPLLSSGVLERCDEFDSGPKNLMNHSTFCFSKKKESSIRKQTISHFLLSRAWCKTAKPIIFVSRWKQQCYGHSRSTEHPPKSWFCFVSLRFVGCFAVQKQKAKRVLDNYC